MTWVRARTTGAALRRAGASRIKASQSSGVMVMTVPEPKLMPPLAAVPGSTSSTLAPMVAMLLRMAAAEPAPMAIMAITEPTPITIPRVVRSARMGLRLSAIRAVRSTR